jgi:hypothetical protein
MDSLSAAVFIMKYRWRSGMDGRYAIDSLMSLIILFSIHV